MVLALALAACAGTPASTAPSARSADAVASFDHSHAAFAKVLDGAVSSDGRVRYALLREREKALDAYVDGLADVRVHGMSKPEQLAFWVNAYNAATLRAPFSSVPTPPNMMDLDIDLSVHEFLILKFTCFP